jgi:chromosomal replication initiator protein
MMIEETQQAIQERRPATQSDRDDHDGSAFWQVCTEQLRAELPPQQYSAWIKPLTAATFDAGAQRVRVGAPNRFKLDWVKNQFASRIETIAQAYFDRPVQLDLYLDVKAAEAEPRGADRPAPGGDHAHRPAATQANSDGLTGKLSSLEVASVNDFAKSGSSERSRLSPSLTFDTFVTGKANQLARAAASQVADNPGKSYNPLFLHGGVGLGKTHLIQAVGNQIISRNPAAKIRYIHADQFVADVVRAYQRKAFENFKQIYHSLDLLLIDDIQFFSRKDGTQEQFFYVFEALTAAKKQIIITSDTYPAEMQGIDERLVSRFGSGLTVAVEPPELEMRVAILLKKAEQEGRPLSDDVAFFVAKHSRSNVRELEGALRKLFVHSDFHGKEITIEMARDALKDMLSVQRAQISVESIQKTVADFYKIKVADMFSARRPTNIARPRQIAMYFAKELTQKSLPEIGELFGGRDHTTVLHAVRKINELRGKHPELNRELHVLLQTLKG